MAQQYTGQAGVMLADQSDPWLQRPDGSIVTIAWHLVLVSTGECGDCRGGFFAPTENGPTDQGIERCDECNVYAGDLDAALALAALIGPDITVWFEPDTDDNEED